MAMITSAGVRVKTAVSAAAAAAVGLTSQNAASLDPHKYDSMQ